MTSRSAPLFERSWAQRRLALALLCLLSLISPARVCAQPSDPVDLEWTAPAECPGQEEVRARLRKLAGSRKSIGLPLSAEATVTRNESGGLHLHLVIRAGELVGVRNMDGKSCRDLVGASAVALVLLLRTATPLNQDNLAGEAGPGDETVRGQSATDDGSSQAPAAPQEKTSPTAAATAAEGQQPTRPEERQKPRSISARNWHLLLQFPIGALGIGPLRTPNFGIALAAGASFGRWRFLVQGTRWRANHASATLGFQQYNTEIVQQYGADIDLTRLTMLACRAIVISPFELAPCASASVEHVSARGTGAHVAVNAPAATWFAAGIGAQARVYIAPWLSLFLGMDGELEFSRPRLSVDGVGTIEHLAPAAATVTVGSEWIF